MKRCLAAVALFASPANAQGLTDPARLDREIAGFTGAAIGAPGGAAAPVDRRLRLASCAGPLALSWYGARRDSLVVRCPDPGGWRIFVPVSVGPGSAPQPNAVARGEQVKIAVSGEGFVLSQSGEALEAGPVGAWIRVRTAAGTAGIRARVIRPGLVAVRLDEDLP